MTRRTYSGNAVPTTLANAIAGGDLSIQLSDPSGYPTGLNGPFFISIDRDGGTEEKILCSGRTGDLLTVTTRGADGTTPQPHAKGATVAHVWTAIDADEANAHVNATNEVHGVPGNLADVITDTAEEAASASMTNHLAAADPHPQYQTAPESQAQVDAKMAAHESAPDPHAQYQTAAESQAQVDAKMTAHEGATDPHPQYLNTSEGAALMPVGVIVPYGGTSAPNADWLMCNGQAVSRTTYAALFAVLGTAYGAGDGTATFNVPDTTGRFLHGGVPGQQGGSETHQHGHVYPIAKQSNYLGMIDPGTAQVDVYGSEVVFDTILPVNFAGSATVAAGSVERHWQTSTAESSYPPYLSVTHIIRAR